MTVTNWWNRRQRLIAPYLFLSPFFLILLIFGVYAVLYSLQLSFFKVEGIGGERVFVGLRNYLALLEDKRFIRSVINSSYYAAGSVFILTPLALFLAVALNSKIVPWKSFYRLAFFVPVITSAVVVSIMFILVFEQKFGLLNAGLKGLGIAPIPWLRHPAWAMPSIILMGIWTWTGYEALYFLGGLQNIPVELQEAARIDGANEIQVFQHVTIPLLRPVIIFVVIQAIIGSYNLFAQPKLLTGGGPQDATLTMTMYLYFNGFSLTKLGYASAIGYALTLIIFMLSVLQIAIFGRQRND